MAFRSIENFIVEQEIDATSTTKKHPLGMIVRAEDPTYGVGEFIYLQGVGSTTVGAVVEYDSSFATGLASIALDLPRPLAVAMSANVASQYGWYQISGLATVSKASGTSFAADAALGATSGEAVAAASGLIVQGAAVASAASGASAVTTVLVNINRPHGPSDVS